MPTTGARFPIPTVSAVEVVSDTVTTSIQRDPRTDLLLDAVTHDIVIERGDLVMVSGPRARGQRIKIALSHIRGEWFLDATQGTDWFGSVLGKSSDLMRRAELRRRLMSVPGVREITEIALSTDPATRALSGTIQVRDMTGAELRTTVEGV